MINSHLDARIAHDEVTTVSAVPLQITIQFLKTYHARHFFACDRTFLARIHLRWAIPTAIRY